MRKNTVSSINKFFSSKEFGVVGVSDDRKKFGNIVFRTMKERNMKVYPVNPRHESIEGTQCYPNILEMPDSVKSVITVVPPAATEKIIADCVQKGISALWMQQGSESTSAIEEAELNGITVIRGECILMFLEPVKSFHAFHRMVNKFVGAYPH